MKLKDELRKLIAKVKETEGTSTEGAIRDILTDIGHICHDEGIDFDDRVDAAIEIALQEIADGD